MLDICIYAYDSEQAKELCNIIQNYVHCPPRFKQPSGKSEFILPFINITIVFGVNPGYRYDIVYYDERYDQTAINEIIWPQCVGSRPRPLRILLERLK